MVVVVMMMMMMMMISQQASPTILSCLFYSRLLCESWASE
jgi:hypothetical protein